MQKQLFQLSGIVSMIAGTSLGIYQLLHPNRDAHSVLNSPYSLIHDIGLFSVALIVFAVIGLYLSVAERLGKAGLVNFIVVILGSTLESGILWVDAYLNPALATFVPDIQTTGHSSGGMHTLLSIFGFSIILFPITWLLFIVGHIWFALNLMRSGKYPKLAGWLIIVGTPLFGGQLLVPLWVETVGGLLLGLGYLLAGYTLFEQASAHVNQLRSDTKNS